MSHATRKARLFTRLLPLGLATALAAPVLAQQPAGPETKLAERWTLLEDYCLSCHNFEDWAGGLTLDDLAPAGVPEHAEVWELALRKLRGRLMPPPGNPMPEDEELQAFVSSLEATLDAAATAKGPRPGRVAIHRLNRAEYAREIKRLLDVDIDATELLPPDTRSDGFENVAEVLQVSPTFLDQYIAAARDISILAVGNEAAKPEQLSYQAPDPLGQHAHVRGLPLGTRGGFLIEHYFPADARYQISLDLSSAEGTLVRSYPTGWLEWEHTVVLTLDGVEVFREALGGEADLKAVDQGQQQAVDKILARFKDIELAIPAGRHEIGVAFIARTFAESDRKLAHSLPGLTEDSIPLVLGMAVTGPFDPAGQPDTPSRRKLFSCYPENADQERACAEQVIGELAQAAFRRPLRGDDLRTLMGFYDAGQREGGFETGVQKAVMAILASPKFLYRAEELPAGVAPGEVYPLNDLELASRLAFFLWGQGPDAELLRVAESGELRNEGELARQVERLLHDPRARSLVSNFALQWLKAGDIDAIDPDPRLFPAFDPTLRQAFKEELALFVDSILAEDRSVTELLSASHTFVNERLARHYGLNEVRGDRFRRIELSDSRRWGLLGKGGVLMLTSYPNRTSPVLRGAWILETLMGTPPAAPPPDVETVLEDSPGAQPTTVRERLEQHRANPACNGCHGVIDPLGLALENFDAVGMWRDKDRWAGRFIDASGQLASGQPIQGPEDLREALLDEPEHFVMAFTEKLMTYALGRAVTHQDMPVVRAIVRDAAAEDWRFSALVRAIVNSEPFRLKQAEAAPGGAGGTTLSLHDNQ